MQRVRAAWPLIGGWHPVGASDWSAPGTPEAGGDASDAARLAPDTSLLFSLCTSHRRLGTVLKLNISLDKSYNK